MDNNRSFAKWGRYKIVEKLYYKYYKTKRRLEEKGIDINSYMYLWNRFKMLKKEIEIQKSYITNEDK